MRRFPVPFPLLVAAAANTFSFSMCAAFGGPFGHEPAARVTTEDRIARWSGTLAPPAPHSGAARPRQLRQGRCDQDSVATATRRTPMDGRSFVSVSTSPAQRGTIIACDNLVPRTQ